MHYFKKMGIMLKLTKYNSLSANLIFLFSLYFNESTLIIATHVHHLMGNLKKLFPQKE